MTKGKKKWLIGLAILVGALQGATQVGVLPPVVAPIVLSVAQALGAPALPDEAPGM